MEYISAEEFLKQPKEVQKVFLDWWKCDNGDLYVNNYELKTERNYCNVRCCNIDLESNLEGEWEWFKGESTPLLTEGQLRKFIEDKTDSKLEVMYIGGYSIRLSRNNPEGKNVTFSKRFLEKDLLKSYWIVALEIAKECVSND